MGEYLRLPPPGGIPTKVNTPLLPSTSDRPVDAPSEDKLLLLSAADLELTGTRGALAVVSDPGKDGHPLLPSLTKVPEKKHDGKERLCLFEVLPLPVSRLLLDPSPAQVPPRGGGSWYGSTRYWRPACWPGGRRSAATSACHRTTGSALTHPTSAPQVGP